MTETGKALESILSQVRAISVNVTAIVEGAKEQATGLKEINTAVNTMDQGTQQNAAMVEESTAASHSLAKEAEALFQLIGRFEISASHTRSAQPEINTMSASLLSPARRVVNRVAAAVRGNAAVKNDEWQDF